MNAGLWLLLSLVTCSVGKTACCNEAVCASVVSRCTLLKSCDCELDSTGCPCCKSCFACLEHLQFECCSCVGLCPETNATTDVGPRKKSVVADLVDPDARARRHLPGSRDPSSPNWSRYIIRDKDREDRDVNCTVVYLNMCTGEKSCEKSCLALGAAAYRWFFDGCCECVGPDCPTDGSHLSGCDGCSREEEHEELELNHASEEERDLLAGASSTERRLPPWKKSIVARLDRPARVLWEAVARDDDGAGRWRPQTFREDPVDRACSVAYRDGCVSEERCEALCRTDGAAKYRWFPNGCCECVAEGCPNYGADEIGCRACEGEDGEDVPLDRETEDLQKTSLKEKLPQN